MLEVCIVGFGGEDLRLRLYIRDVQFNNKCLTEELNFGSCGCVIWILDREVRKSARHRGVSVRCIVRLLYLMIDLYYRIDKFEL